MVGLRPELADQFEQVTILLRQIDADFVLEAANDRQRTQLVNETIESVIVYPYRLLAAINRAPPR